MALLLSLPLESKILQPLYRTLFLKLHINRNYLSVIITVHLALGSLGLKLIKIEQIIESINLFISLCISITPIVYLLRESLEMMQLESGLLQLVLELDYKSFGALVIDC